MPFSLRIGIGCIIDRGTTSFLGSSALFVCDICLLLFPGGLVKL
jgi:hypothetical protein